MNTRQKIAVITMASLLGFTPAWASDDYSDNGNGFLDTAKVVNVRPIYKTVRINNPRRECWNEERVVRHNGHNKSATPVVIGGLLGGVIGSRFGKGRGKDVATVAGVALGASIASDMRSNKHSGGSRFANERVCQTSNEYTEEEQVNGYRVSYRYKGNTYVTRMGHRPGKRIKVRVQVSPVS